jgi:hypothetical protein
MLSHHVTVRNSMLKPDYRLAFLLIIGAAFQPLTGWAQTDYGTLNPGAPPQTAQYAFIIGKWDCATRFLTQPGEYSEGHATWTGSYILDGWAIQDLWAADTPEGIRRGMNIRSFNPASGKWDNRWLSQGNLQWKYFESEMVGDTMVMIGGEGTDQRGDFVDRNTFYEIKEDSWRWRKDRSWDGGETWFEGIGFIEATRID